MKIAVIQPDIVWENIRSNLEKLDDLIKTVPAGTEIVILPEMFSTGFTMNPAKLAENERSDTLYWMESIAIKNDFAMCGSYIIKHNSDYFNRWIFVTPDKKYNYYNKRHLFSPGGEDKIYTLGTKRVVFTFRGVRICPNICYDLRFPVWSRNRDDYDLLINSANWPGNRRDVWITLLKARAIENQCYVAGANRVGTDGTNITYRGDSMIISPKGEIIASLNRNEPGVIAGDISMEQLIDFRTKFPASKDADNFTLQL